MGSSIARASRTVGGDARYEALFARAFNVRDSEPVTPLRLRQALAAYVRTLVAGCGTCHFAPLFSGNTPPRYVASDAEVITSVDPSRPRVLDADSGRASIDHRPEHLRAFKVPSLRNVALTAPYMHNGAFRTLDDVMRFYEVRGGAGAGARLTNQTLPADSLELSKAERGAVIAFLRSLSDTHGLPVSGAAMP